MFEKGAQNKETTLQSKIGEEDHSFRFEEQTFEKLGEDIGMSGLSGKLSTDDFDILKVIGRGTFGKVFMVRKKPKGLPDDN